MRIRSLSASQILVVHKGVIGSELLHRSIAQLLHQLAGLFIADGEVGHLQLAPAPGLAQEKVVVVRTIWRTRAWRNRCGCTGAASPAGPCREARSARTRTFARSEASFTINQASPRCSAPAR